MPWRCQDDQMSHEAFSQPSALHGAASKLSTISAPEASAQRSARGAAIGQQRGSAASFRPSASLSNPSLHAAAPSSGQKPLQSPSSQSTRPSKSLSLPSVHNAGSLSGS